MQDGLMVSVIVLNEHGDLLAQSSGKSLPEVCISPNTRCAYSVTREAEQLYGLHLFCFGWANGIAEGPGPQRAAIARLKDDRIPDGFSWTSQTTLLKSLPEEQKILLQRANEEIKNPGNFCFYNSLNELRSWYGPILEARNLRELRIEQWNGDRFFQLFRIITQSVSANGEAPLNYWFKAVGEPNTQEFAVTQALTSELPLYFPPIAGTLPGVRGWLMQEAQGGDLDEQTDRRPWVYTARVLAKVQMRFVGREEELLALGCKDWRVPQVLDRIDPFFEHMVAAMERQPVSPPERLSRSELREMVTQCKEICYRIQDLGVPDTIAHGDFSPHNVLVSNGWPVFIDWAEAYLTFPFVSWEYYWNRMLKGHPDYAIWHERMHRNYAYRQWASMLGRKKVDEGLRLAPPYATLVHALYAGHGDIRDGLPPGSEKFKRASVRKIRRDLQSIFAEVSPV